MAQQEGKTLIVVMAYDLNLYWWSARKVVVELGPGSTVACEYAACIHVQLPPESSKIIVTATRAGSRFLNKDMGQLMLDELKKHVAEPREVLKYERALKFNTRGELKAVVAHIRHVASWETIPLGSVYGRIIVVTQDWHAHRAKTVLEDLMRRKQFHIPVEVRPFYHPAGTIELFLEPIKLAKDLCANALDGLF